MLGLGGEAELLCFSGSTSASTDLDIKLGLPAYDDPGIT